MPKYRKIDHKSFYLLLLLVIPLIQLCDRVIDKDTYQFELQVFQTIDRHRNFLLDFIFTNIYRISGTYFTGAVVLIALIILIRRRYWQEVKALVFATLGILLLVDKILKPLFDRPRPPKPRLVSDLSPDSFPSGHAAGNLVFYFYLSFVISARYPHLTKYVYSFATILVLLIGFSSIYTKAHWATDIIAGYSFGYFWLLLSLGLLRFLTRHQ